MEKIFEAKAEKGGEDGYNKRDRRSMAELYGDASMSSIAEQVARRRANRSVETWNEQNFRKPFKQDDPEELEFHMVVAQRFKDAGNRFINFMRGVMDRASLRPNPRPLSPEPISPVDQISDVKPMYEGERAVAAPASSMPPPFDFAVQSQTEEKLHLPDGQKAVDVLPKIEDQKLKDVADDHGEKRVVYKTGLGDMITQGWEQPFFGAIKHGQHYREQIDDAEALFERSRQAAREQAAAIDQVELLENELVLVEDQPTIVDALATPAEPTTPVAVEEQITVIEEEELVEDEAIELVHDQVVYLREWVEPQSLEDEAEVLLHEEEPAAEIAPTGASLEMLRKLKHSAEAISASMANPGLAVSGAAAAAGSEAFAPGVFDRLPEDKPRRTTIQPLPGQPGGTGESLRPDGVAVAVEQQPQAIETDSADEPAQSQPSPTNEPVSVSDILANSPRFSAISPSPQPGPRPTSSPTMNNSVNPAMIITIIGIIVIGLILIWTL